jgi:phage terminase Nu1 subunit (DNA packaging protein)
MRAIKRIWQRHRYAGESFVGKDHVAEHFDVSTRTVERWVVNGCPLLRLNGGSPRFRLREVEAWHRKGARSVDRAVGGHASMSAADHS